MPIAETDLIDGSEIPDKSALATGAWIVPVLKSDGTDEGGITAQLLGRLGGDVVNVLAHGVVGDGTTDDSAAIQAAIDANKGKAIYFPAGRQYLAAGILLDGSTYDDTQLVFDGVFLLKAAATAGTTNFGGKWCGLIIRACDGVTVRFNGNGNRANQPETEQQAVVIIAGATRVSIPQFVCHEVMGDGLNINQATHTSESAQARYIRIGSMHCENSAAAGRNALSIIAGEDIQVDSVTSINVGGVISGGRMPGGVDIEPNHTWGYCRRIQFGKVLVIGEGTSNFAVHGRAGADVTSDVQVDSLIVRSTVAPTVNDAAAALTQTANGCCLVATSKRVTIADALMMFTNAYGDALTVVESDEVRIRGRARHVRIGAQIGAVVVGGTATFDVTNSHIHLDVDDVSRRGFWISHAVDSTFTGSVRGPVSGMYTSSLMAVNFSHYNTPQPVTRCRLSIDIPYSATWVRAYWNDNTFPQTFTDCVVENCTVRGFSDLLGAGSLDVHRVNVAGVTDGTAAPTAGTWRQGTIRWRSDAAASGAAGWMCTVSGAPGTWKAMANLAA